MDYLEMILLDIWFELGKSGEDVVVDSCCDAYLAIRDASVRCLFNERRRSHDVNNRQRACAKFSIQR